MLQRSEANGAGIDCEDTDVVLACLEDLDNCPAACKAEYEDGGETSDEVVKSGDLAVTASAAQGKKAIIGGVSDLDTLTFKTSEDVTITRITLERYGYSAGNQVAKVRLEDENGKVISNEAIGLNSKGQAKLTIKKDYRNVDWIMNATVVLQTVDLAPATNGSTIGFKVVDVESTAKNLNVDDYDPYTYDLVKYDGSKVTFTVRGSDKDYNYEEGESFEVAKFRVKASDDSAAVVKGFTLKNDGALPAGVANRIDVEDVLKDVTVTVDDKEVKWVKYTTDKDELTISFDDVEIPAKWYATFAVSIELTDFEDYGRAIVYRIVKIGDFNAIEKKTGTRISDTTPSSFPITMKAYTFKGGKVKLTNTKLGNVEAAYNSTDVVIAEWNVSTKESIEWNLWISVNGAPATWITGTAYAIEGMRVLVGGDEIEGKIVTSTTNDTTPTTIPYAGTVIYKFAWVEVDKDSKFQVLVDVRDDANYEGKKLTFTLEGWDSFTYSDWDGTIDVAGSITVYQLTVQQASATLTRNNSKAVEFKNKESNRYQVFDGTYTTKKSDVYLNEFSLTGATTLTALSSAAVACNPTAVASPALTDIATYYESDGLTTWTPWYLVDAWWATYSKTTDTAIDTTKTYYTIAAGSEGQNARNTTVRFYVSIDGEEVADGKVNCAAGVCSTSDSFTNVLVEAGKSVNVKVEAEVDASKNATLGQTWSLGEFDLTLAGEDVNGNKAGAKSKKIQEIKIVETGTPTISASTNKATVLRRASDSVIATFTVKPANGASQFDFDSMSFNITNVGNTDNLTVSIDNKEYDQQNTSLTAPTYEPNLTVNSDGVVVEIRVDVDELATTTKLVTVSDLVINTTPANKTFTKAFVNDLVSFAKVDEGDMEATLWFDVDLDDSADTVSNVKVYVDATSWAGCTAQTLTSTFDTTQNGSYCLVDTLPTLSEGSDNDLEVINPTDSAKFITAIEYTSSKDGTVTILKKEFDDYFKIGSNSVKLPKSK